MIKVGITGSISSGKSTVCKIISKNRGPIYSADKIVAKLYKNRYVRKTISKKLAFDHSYRENISNQILSKSKDHLFNDNDIYKQYIDFFQKSLEAAYKKELLPKNWEPSMDNQY